jgi:hypothetical protein
MLANGLMIVVNGAVEAAGHAEPRYYRDALLLGALREDVRRAPLRKRVYEHLSFTHFSGRFLPGGFIPLLWAGPGAMADRFFDRAVAKGRAGERAAAYVQLGRALHLLSDMACPVHAQRVIHETDPYEWLVESEAPRLGRLPVPPPPRASRPSELVAAMAALSQARRADATRSAVGRLLRRAGLRRPVGHDEAAAQAEFLIPQAAAHAAALLGLFLERSAAPVP